MERNVARLTRSLRKWNRQFSCDLAETYIAEFESAAMARTPGPAGAPSVSGVRA
jgi:hypothetical protein